MGPFSHSSSPGTSSILQAWPLHSSSGFCSQEVLPHTQLCFVVVLFVSLSVPPISEVPSSVTQDSPRAFHRKPLPTWGFPPLLSPSLLPSPPSPYRVSWVGVELSLQGLVPWRQGYASWALVEAEQAQLAAAVLSRGLCPGHPRPSGRGPPPGPGQVAQHSFQLGDFPAVTLGIHQRELQFQVGKVQAGVVSSRTCETDSFLPWCRSH